MTPQKPNNETYLEAERLRAKGFAIVPLRPKSKIPAEGYSSKTTITKKKKLKQYFDANPDANYGIATGQASNLVVLDVDGKPGKKALKALKREHVGFPQTVVVETGRGKHFYFTSTSLIKNSASTLSTNLDVRGEGGYVVGPGSVHENGTRYKYSAGRKLGVQKMATSEWLSSRLAERCAPPTSSDKPAAVVAEGGRNKALISHLGGLVRKGVVGEDLAVLARDFNSKFQEPLSDAEVAKTIKSAMTYATVDHDMDVGEAFAKAVLEVHYSDGTHLMRLDDGLFWAYDGKKWAIENVDLIRKKTLTVIEQNPKRVGLASTTLMSQVLDILKAKVMRIGDPLRFTSTPPAVLNLRNGELWLNPDGSATLSPHKASSNLRHFLDVDYDEAATCPEFDKALKEIFPGKHADIIPYLHEIFGYILQPERPIALILIWKGSGGNGKSALAGLITDLLGKDSVAALRIRDLARNQFSTNSLFGRLLFLDDDVQSGTRLPDGDLKRISEKKVLTAERKFSGHYSFENRAVPLLLCNNPPSITDLSPGLQRRLQVLPFERQFSEEEIDTKLFDRIRSDELSGVLNAAIIGYQRLVRRGWRLEVPKSVKAATGQFFIDANPVPAFLDDVCERGKGSCLVADVYSRYEIWCRDQGITMAQQRSSFERNLVSLGFISKKRNNGKTFLGLTLRTP